MSSNVSHGLKDRKRNRLRSRSRSTDHQRHSHRRKKKSNHKRKKHRKRYHSRSPSNDYSSSISDYSSYDSMDSYDYYSSSSEKRHKRAKNKKRKKHKKNKKRKKHKKKKSKKHRKHSKNSNSSVNILEEKAIAKPDQYKQGQFGFIGAKDLFSKLPEFTSWLIEVHNVSRDELGSRDEKKYWARFCDDFNTATMPDDKYYNLEVWNRKYLEEQMKNMNNVNDVQIMNFIGTDEDLLRRQRKEFREQQTNKAYQERVSAMITEMKHLKNSKSEGFQRLVAKHAPKKETFESLAAKRRQKKVEERVKRYGRYGGNVTWE